MTTAAIRAAALEIQQDPRASDIKEQEYKLKYPHFFDKYETLAKMCCNGSMETSRLDFMLELLDRVKNRQLSQDKASEKIGENLFATFVAPKVKDMKFK